MKRCLGTFHENRLAGISDGALMIGTRPTVCAPSARPWVLAGDNGEWQGQRTHCSIPTHAFVIFLAVFPRLRGSFCRTALHDNLFKDGHMLITSRIATTTTLSLKISLPHSFTAFLVFFLSFHLRRAKPTRLDHQEQMVVTKKGINRVR